MGEVSAHTTLCGRALERLRGEIERQSALHAEADQTEHAAQHFEGVASLIVAHLIEMWALRLFGPNQLASELERMKTES